MTVKNAHTRGVRTDSRQRMADAFQSLRDAGVNARMRLLCCRHCAASALRNRPSEVIHAYFSAAEDETAKKTGALKVFFGSTIPQNSTRKADIEIGKKVAAAIRAAGLDTEWDEDPERCITVRVPGWSLRR